MWEDGLDFAPEFAIPEDNQKPTNTEKVKPKKIETIEPDLQDFSSSDSSSEESDSGDFSLRRRHRKKATVKKKKPKQPPPPQKVPAVMGMQFDRGVILEKILGINAPLSEFLRSKNQKYYVKWQEKSYVHCCWVTLEDILEAQGGEAALKRFEKKRETRLFTECSFVSGLYLIDEDDLNQAWLQVDRVLAVNGFGFYLVKWKKLDYDQSTWETQADIGSIEPIQQFVDRKTKYNPTKIAMPALVDPREFQEISEAITDKRGRQLRDYQIQGFNWLRFCWYCHRNSILADEMGLGKTVQVVVAIRDIVVNHRIQGPFLVIAPLSTLGHWKSEFEAWTNLNVVVFHGTQTSKQIIESYELNVYDVSKGKVLDRIGCDVVITNYETFRSDSWIFLSVEWRYLVLDEGHKLKNHKGKCYQQLQELVYEHCTLLTGTPVQNNLEELWSLLHFLAPMHWPSLDDFLDEFGAVDDAKKLQELQKRIKPYILRRRKVDVDQSIAAKEETIIEVELTRTQKTCYRALLHENAATLLSHITGQALNPLLNLMMQLRKVCNHPFLLKGMRDQMENERMREMNKTGIDEEVELKTIIEGSGKMIFLDKMLPKLRETGHKVLIFSQMIKVLDILEEYCAIMNYPTERIDGRVPGDERQMAIDKFSDDPNTFIFLLCTRAGGVGINLTAADVVIIYDSDWNPQNDIQAESRCHRIGQTSVVKVYRLVTRGTYEMEMLDRASKKLGLDHALLDGGDINPNQRPMAASEVEKLLRRGVYDLANDDDAGIEEFSRANIDQILENRATRMTRTADGTNVFAKAKFDTGDQLDMNSEDFWAQAMPQLNMKREEALPDRRCKKFKTNESSDYSDSEQPVRRRRRTSVHGGMTARLLMTRIMHSGYGGSNLERAFIAYCARTLEEPLSANATSTLEMCLNLETLEPTPEMKKVEDSFGSDLEDLPKKDALVERVLFYYDVGRVLTLVQDGVTSWPSVGLSNPLSDYALLLGVYANGLGTLDRVMQDIDFEMQRELREGQIHKICVNLTKAFAEQISGVAKVSKEFMPPFEWRQNHPNLFNRATLSEAEMGALVQTVAYLGFPERKSQSGEWEVDWERIASFAGLDCVDIQVIMDVGQDLKVIAMCEEMSSEARLVLKEKVSAVNRVWTARLRSNAQDLFKIRLFMRNLNDDQKAQIKQVRQWDGAPEWWSDEQDLGLLQALADWGMGYVATWLIDEDRPFIKYIPEDLQNECKRIAKQEKERKKMQKPKDNELSFLFNDRIRMARALLIIQYVETHNDTTEPDGKMPNSLTELPKLPLELGSQMIVMSLGKYASVGDQYPIGYKCRRFYFSLADPRNKTWYEAVTELDEHNELQFRVSSTEQPFTSFIHHTPSGAWEQLIQEIQEVRARMNLPKRKHTTVSGPQMYGFANPTIIQCFRLMRLKTLT